MTYDELLKKMPDHLSPAFTEWLITTNKENNTYLYDTEFWICLRNFRHYNGQPDPKYTYKIQEHYTFFSKQSVGNIDELSPHAKIDMLKLQDKMFKDGYYMYWNATATRSIKRLHWHAVRWQLEDGKPIIKSDLTEYLTAVFGEKGL